MFFLIPGMGTSGGHESEEIIGGIFISVLFGYGLFCFIGFFIWRSMKKKKYPAELFGPSKIILDEPGDIRKLLAKRSGDAAKLVTKNYFK
ncbi:MAG: hypothetical protein MUP98_01760 [Candidatus Aminicenantes bacterium]|nr:hypothetical protein [Candidatus Aminicenantes bacterium]